MKDKTAVVFNYLFENKASYNVLSQAVCDRCKNAEVYLVKLELLRNLKEITEKHKIAILALSIMSIQAKEYYELIKKIKLEFPNVIIVAGGPHPTALPEEVLKNGADIVVIGEGEKTFTELVNKIENKKGYNTIKGIAYLNKKTKKMITTKPQTLINLDDYSPIAESNKRYNAIEITRGCVFGCNFCFVTHQTKGKLRHRSIPNIIKYIKIMHDTKLYDVRFVSSNAFGYGSLDGRTINYEALETLLKETRKLFKDRGLFFFGTFPSEVRPEHVNDKTLSLLKQYCDNDNVIIGAQSGSNRILKLCNRGHTIEDIYAAAKLIKSYGFMPYVDFIFGLPFEEKEDQLKTLKAVKELIRIGARIHAHTFMPLPGTAFADKHYVPIDPEIEKEFLKFEKAGKLYGDWKKQKEYACSSK
ncbi:MAG: TIGR04013 family B12-binding domain/radical SAM domain-containing protein [Candidatus Woesearchaeota archaeon]|jgi:B12-binding domain/radical SAM domain protein